MAHAGSDSGRVRGRTGLRRWAARGVAGVCLCAGALWLFGRWSFVIDVAVSQQVLIVAGCVLGVLVCVAMRCRRAAGACVLAVLVAGWPLAAGRTLRAPAVDLSSPPAPGVVRVVSFNIGPENERWEADLDRVLGWHADAVVLIEVPVELNRGVRRRGLLDGSGWSWEHRAWVDEITSPCFVLSRWPMEQVAVPGVAFAERDVLLVRLDVGSRVGGGPPGAGGDGGVGGVGGAVLVGLTHPHSPRTRARWAIGNETVARTVPGMVGAAESLGLPLAVGADLNAGPAGSRARTARSAGLSMAKPLMGGWWGSFPSGWAGPLRVQLDDVWVTPGFEVVAWSSQASEGSDHRIIIADLRPLALGQADR